MARRLPDDDLPDGVVPLPREGRPPGGCGLRGCLYGMVVLFALLLLVLVAIALLRPWPRPVLP